MREALKGRAKRVHAVAANAQNRAPFQGLVKGCGRFPRALPWAELGLRFQREGTGLSFGEGTASHHGSQTGFDHRQSRA